MNVTTVTANQCHSRSQKPQYAQPATAKTTQEQIAENEARIDEITIYLEEQYKQYQPAPRQFAEFTAEIREERKALDKEKMTLLHETHYLRNPQRAPEMDKDSYEECGGKYQHLPLPIIKSNETGDPEFDNRSNTFGDFEAEWDAEEWF